ncbi:hypothetical protein ACEZLA_001808 [Vibrio cholerae]
MSDSNLERFMEIYETSAKENDKFACSAARRLMKIRSLEVSEPSNSKLEIANRIALEAALLCVNQEREVKGFVSFDSESDLERLNTSVKALRDKFDGIKRSHEALKLASEVSERSAKLLKISNELDTKALNGVIGKLSKNKMLDEIERLTSHLSTSVTDNLVSFKLMPDSTVKDYLAHTSVNNSIKDAFRADWANVGSDLWRSYYKVASEQLASCDDNSDRGETICR